MSEEIFVIQPADLEGIVEGSEPALVAKLLEAETRIYGHLMGIAESVSFIATNHLYELRGYDNVRDYIKTYLADKVPYSVGTIMGAVNLSYKMDRSEQMKQIDSEKIKEFIKMSKDPEISKIYAEGKVQLSDGTVLPTEEYKSLIKRDLLKEMDSEIKDSKKALKEQKEALQSEKEKIQAELENAESQIHKLQRDKETTSKLVGVHGDKLSIIVSLANAREFLSGDCTTAISNLYKTINDINLVGIDLRKEEDIVESVEMFFTGLKTAMKRLYNSWSPYCEFADADLGEFGMGEIAVIDESEATPTEAETAQLTDETDTEKWNRGIAIELLSNLAENLRNNVDEGFMNVTLTKINEFQEESGFLSEDVLELIIENLNDEGTPEKLDSIAEELRQGY